MHSGPAAQSTASPDRRFIRGLDLKLKATPHI